MNGRRRVRTHAGDASVSIGANGQVTVDDATFTATPAGDAAWRLVDGDGRARLAYAVATPDGCWVHVDGAVCFIESGTDAADPRRRTRVLSADLSAPMPATVLSIAVREGARVRQGDVLVLLEAMKMELPIRAPRDATVSALRCREGELVQAGVPLVELT